MKKTECRKEHLPTKEIQIWHILQDGLSVKEPLKIIWYMLNSQQLGGQRFLVPSLTSDDWHLVDTVDGTCGEEFGDVIAIAGKRLARCPGFDRFGHCSHLKAISILAELQFKKSEAAVEIETWEPSFDEPSFDDDDLRDPI